MPPIEDGLNHSEPQPMLNYQNPQYSSRRMREGDGKASQRNEPVAWLRGRIARELIENDGAKSYSSKLVERSESEELEGSHYCLENRSRREDTEVDQKLKRLKEQLLMALGAKDTSIVDLITVRETDPAGNYTKKVYDADLGSI